MDVLALQQAKADAAKKYLALTQRAHGGGVGVAVANNCYGTAYDGATKQAALQTGVTGTSRVPHIIGVDCGEIRFVYTNWYTDRLATSAPQTSSSTYADVDGPSSITISATLEATNSTYTGGGLATTLQGASGYRVTFGGRTTATIDPGGMVISDPISLSLVKSQLIYSRTYISSGNWYPNRRSLDTSGSGGFLATTDATAPWYTGQSAPSLPDSASPQYGPSAVLGVTRTASPAVLLVGDSITNGYGDNVTSVNDFAGHNPAQPWRSGGGFLNRALAGVGGTINVAVGGDFARRWAGAQPYVSTVRRQGMSRFCTSAIVAYGRNDLSGGDNVATLQGWLITTWIGLAKRVPKVYMCTILPRATSTDGYFTTANQTPHSSESVRVGVNDWIRDGAPLVSASNLTAAATGTVGALRAGTVGHPLTGYFETADAVESGRNSGFWVTPYLTITDAAMTLGSNVLTSASANFSVARDLSTSVTIRGAGPAGGDLTGNIQAVVNSTTVQLAVVTASATVSGATAGFGIPVTSDGIHPMAGGTRRIATAIDYTKLV